MVYLLRSNDGKQYLVEGKIRLGRDLANQIVLQNSKESVSLAAIWEQAGSLYLEDLSGGAETRVNGYIVNGTVILRLGDQLSLGSTLFTVENTILPPSTGKPVQPLPHAPITEKKEKIRPGCGKWILIALLAFFSECLLIGVLAIIFANTDVEIGGGLQDLRAYFSGSQSSENAPSDVDAPGPKILSLTDLWLSSDGGTAMTQKIDKKAEGVNQKGKNVSTDILIQAEEQSSPSWVSHESYQEMKNGKLITSVEKSVADGKVYLLTDQCSVNNDPENGAYGLDSTPSVLLSKDLKGHVKLVEKAVTINGVVTDRYEIRPDNFVLSDSVIKVIEGSLYRAREGGYLVELDYTVEIKPQSWAINIGDLFSDTEPTKVTYQFSRTYVSEGSIKPKIPEGCGQ